MKKRFNERELLKDLNEDTVHGDELANPLPQELDPQERLKGSVKRYERPFDRVWDEFFDSEEGVSEDFMDERNQPL
ncbi:hypothetical protein [Marinobacter nauticus]|jgi:antitoxin VapB|uniref:hypothetical protein n=1 Tax=Marinobacter nauticus TaxID=2743 RepID=UPI0024204D52|nr:hypothetical protein [Marinobacter nauticus]